MLPLCHMKVFQGLENLPKFTKPVLTIGSFDGVHLGHRKIIEQMKSLANKIGGETIIITFNPHPRLVLGNDTQRVQLLSTVDEKIEALAGLGIDVLVIVPFTKSFSEISAESYIRNFLVQTFHPHTIVIGYDHRFGKNRSGNFDMMAQHQAVFHYALQEIPALELSNIAISSTKIRQALLRGEVNLANQYLCNRYSVFGKVVPGEQKGRLLGFPTANIQVMDYDKLIPANGVYIVQVKLAGTQQQYMGMLNIGVRPTLSDAQQISLEVHIIDLQEDLYGQYLRVELIERLRDEKKFDSLDALITQLHADKARTLDYFTATI